MQQIYRCILPEKGLYYNQDKGTEKEKAQGPHRPNGGNMVIVWHDNGVAGQRGYTEYTNDEVAVIGGIQSIVNEYAENGILVYSVDFIGGEKE